MRRLGAFAAVSLLWSVSLPGQTLFELFQKAKAEVRGESWKAALQTLDTLDRESSRPGSEAARRQLEAPLAFYRGVCAANLGAAEEARASFAAYLAEEPRATMDPSMYSKKAVTAFEAARKSASPPAEEDDASAIFASFQEFKLPRNSGEAVSESWADGPIRWIMTAEEKRRWVERPFGANLQEFADDFWEARNPRPGNPDNVAKTTFDRRVAYADAHFVVAEGTRGSMTDRGMVFVLLGPPTYIGRRPMRAGEDGNDAAGMSRVSTRATEYAQRALTKAGEPAGSSGLTATDAFFGPGARALDSNPSWREIWHYRRELLPKSLSYQQVDIEFIARRSDGSAVLQRDPAALTTLDAARPRAD